MKKLLFDKWCLLTKPYCSKKEAHIYFDELVKHYTKGGRFYHNLSHIDNLLQLVNCYSDKIKNKAVFQFAVWYHDVIYAKSRSDNEAKSAVFAKARLQKMGVEAKAIEQVVHMINRTANHTIIEENEEDDLQLFLDMDLWVLGQPANIYQQYAADIRKEYKFIPGFIYNKSRKKVLKKFIVKPFIYRTKLFIDHFEAQARVNLLAEIEQL